MYDVYFFQISESALSALCHQIVALGDRQAAIVTVLEAEHKAHVARMTEAFQVQASDFKRELQSHEKEVSKGMGSLGCWYSLLCLRIRALSTLLSAFSV